MACPTRGKSASKLAASEWVGNDVVRSGEARCAARLPSHGLPDRQRRGGAGAVFFAVASLLNLEVDLLFFDTTSTYFEDEDDDEQGELRRFGHSKDNRADRPQVLVGLAVTREGIPVRVWTFPGNTADATAIRHPAGEG